MAKKYDDLDTLKVGLQSLTAPGLPEDQRKDLRVRFLAPNGLLDKLMNAVGKYPLEERADRRAALTVFKQDINALLG